MIEIDTGVSEDNPLRLVPDWFLDRCNDPQDVCRVVHDYAYHLIGALENPRSMATVRKHTLAQWSFLRALADLHPEVFDEFICAYAERFHAQ